MNDPRPNSSCKKFTLADLLCEQTRDLYDAENRHRETVRQSTFQAVTVELTEYLAHIMDDADENISTLEEICALLEVPPTGVECQAMAGLVREAKESAAEWNDSFVLDAAIISNEQRIVHYQIAGYGTALAFSRVAKLPAVAEKFRKMLEAAKRNDKTLTKIACGGWLETGVNEMALTEGERATH